MPFLHFFSYGASFLVDNSLFYLLITHCNSCFEVSPWITNISIYCSLSSISLLKNHCNFLENILIFQRTGTSLFLKTLVYSSSFIPPNEKGNCFVICLPHPYEKITTKPFWWWPLGQLRLFKDVQMEWPASTQMPHWGKDSTFEFVQHVQMEFAYCPGQ